LLRTSAGEVGAWVAGGPVRGLSTGPSLKTLNKALAAMARQSRNAVDPGIEKDVQRATIDFHEHFDSFLSAFAPSPGRGVAYVLLAAGAGILAHLGLTDPLLRHAVKEV
jgi:hypothetical protein